MSAVAKGWRRSGWWLLRIWLAATALATGCADDSGATGSSSGVGGGGDGAGGEGPGGPDGLAFPVLLTPLGPARASTAHIELYFTVADANHEPVAGLLRPDFEATEDGEPIDDLEAAFQVETPPASELRIPMVLLLDLSRSVVEAGALETVKSAAHTVVDSLGPSQELAILTFADEVHARTDFTEDVTELRAAIDAIDEADGVSTNLYGALTQGFSLWNDGYAASGSQGQGGEGGYMEPPDGPGKLTAGLLIAISDGNDTAGVATLEDVESAQGDRRALFIRVGEDVDRDVAEVVGNAGVVDTEGGFDGLASAVDEAIDRVGQLSKSIYVAEYCSPKRAGAHQLEFTVRGNGEVADPHCKPTGPGPSCSGEASLYCGPDRSGEYDYVCCPPDHPFHCGDTCHATAAEAAATCGSACRACSAPLADGGVSAGGTLVVEFDAGNFDAEQCGDLFAD